MRLPETILPAVRDVRAARQPDERHYVERQGPFYYERASGLTLSGKPDLVVVRGNHATVVDTKTGSQRASDAAQVKLYMHCLPLAKPEFAGMSFSGRVVYQDGHETNIPPDAIVGEFADQFEYWLDVLDSDDPPERAPSEPECAFCNIGHGDCPDRMAAVLIEDV